MVSGGEGPIIKCYRVVHAVGREPSERERPCTAQETAARIKDLESAKVYAKQIKDWSEFLASHNFAKVTEALDRCAKKFGATACNR